MIPYKDANGWLYFALIFLVMGPRSLGIACIMLQVFGVPFPRERKKRKGKRVMTNRRRLR